MDFKLIARALEVGDISSVEGLTFESFLFLLEQHSLPVCVAADSGCVENISVLFQERIGEDVACVLLKQQGSIGDIDQHFFASSISTQLLATKLKDVSLVFSDGLLLDKPLIPIEKTGGFSVSQHTSFDFFLKSLLDLGFSKTKDSLVPGTFIVRGGVVDLLLFNANKTYRISFLESFCRVFCINKQNNKITKELLSLGVLPKTQKNKKSLSQVCAKSFIFYNYYNGILSLQKTKNHKKTLKINCLPVDYQLFIKNKPSDIVFLNSLFERGFRYKKKLFIPKWFKRRPAQDKQDSSPFNAFGVLEIGGTYIHDDFGFCSFLGFERTQRGEKACLRFADGVVKLDIKYMSKLSFVSLDNKKLSFLNKPSLWKRKKSLVEERANEFVGGLVDAYSKRERISSLSLNVQDDLISDFVHSFPYKDTVGQSLCWKEILNDLESSFPMNRLVCGDVGFGKTELAIRAAFVSAFNKQQVVVVAPTTILANQLYHCFRGRLDPFGVSAGCLSRITANKKNIISSFINKKIDVLVGTSAVLFQKNILKQCGLFIVDEEHRFGVENKEKVFQYNPGVNFLSLSATPIPRSMQLSLSGVRNFSVIQTPPVARKPIISSLNYFSEDLIKTIIIKETSRSGQVFFVDNSVRNLKKLFKKLSGDLPFLDMGIIYGSLKGRNLTDTMDLFVKGKTQVLFSTSIIESGIDIGSTNTIIINNAHLFGLSQLYQLRGRVGRSATQAFAWFLFSKKQILTEEGLARLKTIIKYSALGSGYQVALSDLEIRGAGSLFGYNQSGGGSVGFEYYSKMMSLAINKQKNIVPLECLVDLFNPSIPESFLSNEKERAFYYKKIFSSTSVAELNNIKKSLVSVFGVCVKEVLLLIQNKTLSLIASKKNISRISKKEGVVSVYFSIKKTDLVIDDAVCLIVDFFTKRGINFWFLKSHKNLIFQYKSSGKDDYILLSSFINKIHFF